jgi:hypothetical protein
MPLDQLEHGDRICAVAHEVAEESATLRSQGFRVLETRGDRFEIAVDIGEQGYLQAELVFWMR